MNHAQKLQVSTAPMLRMTPIVPDFDTNKIAEAIAKSIMWDLKKTDTVSDYVRIIESDFLFIVDYQAAEQVEGIENQTYGPYTDWVTVSKKTLRKLKIKIEHEGEPCKYLKKQIQEIIAEVIGYFDHSEV